MGMGISRAPLPFHAAWIPHGKTGYEYLEHPPNLVRV